MVLPAFRRLYRICYVLMLAGLVIGLATYFSILTLGARYWLSIHAGVWALMVNMLVCLVSGLIVERLNKTLTHTS